ncbi:hypothetical protein ACIQMJ_26510 [Actinosynnema sp. NPDC091369]
MQHEHGALGVQFGEKRVEGGFADVGAPLVVCERVRADHSGVRRRAVVVDVDAAVGPVARGWTGGGDEPCGQDQPATSAAPTGTACRSGGRHTSRGSRCR